MFAARWVSTLASKPIQASEEFRTIAAPHSPRAKPTLRFRRRSARFTLALSRSSRSGGWDRNADL